VALERGEILCILCCEKSKIHLETDIRKAQINKEVLVGVFIDVENAYDMLWKEGLLIKLDMMGIKGKI